MQIKRFDAEALLSAIPYPARDANKYTRGKLTVIGGSDAFPGAACLASKAGLVAGAGYVLCACAPQTVPLVQSFAPSLVVRSWEGVDAASLGLSHMDERHPQACLIGSGMAHDDAIQDELVGCLIEGCACPLVIDGGAIRAVAGRGWQDATRQRANAGCITVMTPHGGEAAALGRAAGVPLPPEDGSDEDAAAFAQRLADAYGAHILLKGPVSFIAGPQGDVVYQMDQGTPALAKAGTGDVLAGVTGALLAQAVPAPPACALAATVHAEAGRAAARDHGMISVTAEDVLEHLPQAFCAL